MALISSLVILAVISVVVSQEPPASTAIGLSNGWYLNAAGNQYMVQNQNNLWTITSVGNGLYTITNGGSYLSAKVGGSGYNTDGAGATHNQFRFTQAKDGTWEIFNPYLGNYNGYGWLCAADTPYGPYCPYFCNGRRTLFLPAAPIYIPPPTPAPTSAPTSAPTPTPTPCQTGYGLGPNGCSICPRGTYSEGHTCEVCAPGTTATEAGQSSCVPCAPGFYGAGGDSACVAAPAGYYSPGGALRSTACSPGTFAASAGSSACTPCANGTVSCAAASACSVCAAGRISHESRAFCVACPPGTYAAAGASQCSSCPANTYNAKLAGTSVSACVACPSGKTTPKCKHSLLCCV